MVFLLFWILISHHSNGQNNKKLATILSKNDDTTTDFETIKDPMDRISFFDISFLAVSSFFAIYHFINHIFNKLILFWNTDFSICSYVPTVLGNMWSDPWWWYIRSHKKLKPFEIIAFNRDTVNNLSRLNVRLDCHLPREFEYSWFRGLEITCNFFCDFGDFVIWWYVIRRGGG